MINEKVRLRTVSFVQLNLTSRAMKLVTQFLDESLYLEDLDVSWNDLVPLSFTPMLEVLSRNKSLKSLNLSWNTIIDKADQNNKFDFKFQSALLEYV